MSSSPWYWTDPVGPPTPLVCLHRRCHQYWCTCKCAQQQGPHTLLESCIAIIIVVMITIYVIICWRRACVCARARLLQLFLLSFALAGKRREEPTERGPD